MKCKLRLINTSATVMDFLLYFLFALPLVSTHTTYRIRPTLDPPYEDTLTLSEYAARANNFHHSEIIELSFLSGKHALNTSIAFKNFESLVLRGSLSSLPDITSTVMCTSNSTFTIESISTVEIKGLKFVACGRQDETELVYKIAKMGFSLWLDVPHLLTEVETVIVKQTRPALSIARVPRIQFQSCSFEYNVFPLLVNQSEAHLQDTVFVNNTGAFGGAIAVYKSLVLFKGDVIFSNNRATVGGGIFANSSELVFIGLTSFDSNSASYGGGGCGIINSTLAFQGANMNKNVTLREQQPHGNVSLGRHTSVVCNNSQAMRSSVVFRNNKGVGGGILMVSSTLDSFGTLIAFIGNSGREGGGINSRYSEIHFGSESVTCSGPVNPLIQFLHNFAGVGGAIWAYSSKIFITVNSHFKNNRASSGGFGYGGGVYASRCELDIQQANFFENEADNGGGMFIEYGKLTLSENNSFVENKAKHDGGALYMTDTSLLASPCRQQKSENSMAVSPSPENIHNHCSLTVTMKKNSAGYYTSGKGGAIHAVNSHLDMTGRFMFDSNKAIHNAYGGAIFVERTKLSLKGQYIFSNNSAQNGGALAILGYMDPKEYISDHAVYLRPNTSMEFQGNTAYFGGAIFIHDSSENYCSVFWEGPHCFVAYAPEYSYNNFINCRLVACQHFNCTPQLIFRSNYAKEAGNIIYGGALSSCRVKTASLNLNYFVLRPYPCYISGIETIAYLSQLPVPRLLSNPLNIANDTYRICTCNSQKHDCFTMHINNTVYPGETIAVYVLAKEYDKTIQAVVYADVPRLSNVSLNDLQKTQLVSTNCTPLMYTLFSRGSIATKLLLSAEGKCKTRGTPLAVRLNILPCPIGFSLSSSGSCTCETRLQKYTNTCDINTRMFTRSGDFWLGFDSHGAILHPHCPFQYCTSESVSFTYNSTDLQCANGRSGILCGACKNGLSLKLGSANCSSCSNVYLLLILPIAVAGFLLVILLFVFQVTVADGTVSGIILYANVIEVNRNVFFSNGKNFLSAFIAWMNLDLGIDTCFFDGMDMYALTWLQFVFPLYIWALVGLVTVVSYYSTAIARIIGPTNPISVLATLFLLSYTKLLRTIITTLSFTTLDYQNDNKVLVWVYDGNVRYLDGKHIPMFLVGMFAFMCLFLPYTLLLIFGQWILAGSNHKLLFWANNTKLRSLFDAYHGPYKTRHRYWTGMLLLLRFALFITSAIIDINLPKDPSVNLLVLGITMVVVMVCVWNLGTPYRKWYNTLLESSFFLNLATLSLVSYQVKVDGGNPAIPVNVSVCIAFATFLGIIAYRLALRLCNTRMWRNEVVPKLNYWKENYLRRHQQDFSTELVDTPASRTQPPVSTTFVDLRESLLDSQHCL